MWGELKRVSVQDKGYPNAMTVGRTGLGCGVWGRESSIWCTDGKSESRVQGPGGAARDVNLGAVNLWEVVKPRPWIRPGKYGEKRAKGWNASSVFFYSAHPLPQGGSSPVMWPLCLACLPSL